MKDNSQREEDHREDFVLSHLATNKLDMFAASTQQQIIQEQVHLDIDQDLQQMDSSILKEGRKATVTIHGHTTEITDKVQDTVHRHQRMGLMEGEEIEDQCLQPLTMDHKETNYQFLCLNHQDHRRQESHQAEHQQDHWTIVTTPYET